MTSRRNNEQPAGANTARGRVQEAIQKGWEMHAEVQAALKESQDKRNAYNAIKGQQNSPAYRENGEKVLAKKAAEMEKLHDQRVAAAQAKVNAAQAAFDKAQAESLAVLKKEKDDARVVWEKELEKRNQELAQQLLMAQAECKEVDDDHNAKHQSLERHLQMTNTSLGVDIRSVVENA
jgi:hypothetical protein